MASYMEVIPDSTLDVLQRAALSEDQAGAIFEQGRDAVVFALLELSKQLAEARGPQATPSTPSGMIPVYEKPPAKSRKKRPGAKTKYNSIEILRQSLFRATFEWDPATDGWTGHADPYRAEGRDGACP